MRKLLFLLGLALLKAAELFSQNTGTVTGFVTESTTGGPLPGAHVYIEQGKGTLTGADGEYQLDLLPGSYTLNAKFIGYKPSGLLINISEGDTVRIDFTLLASIEILNEVVVTAEKSEQKITDVNVSMSLIKPILIEKISASSLDKVLKQVPGFEILDGQPSIRGGSGFSYGAGSRVLVVVEDLPLISGDAGHVQWSLLPLENLSQVEIIKGASSVLYGSSALNGVINMRYDPPGDIPKTSMRLFSGSYLAPAREELIWWKTPRWFSGNSLSHSRKSGNLDVTAGAYLFQDKGYREDEYKEHARLNARLNYRSKKIRGLSYGINTSAMYVNQGDFFLWQDADSGAYRQNHTGTSFNISRRLYFDPSVRYFTEKGGRHSLTTRYYGTSNNMPDNTDKNSRFDLMLGEYRYQKKFSEYLSWTVGSAFNHSRVNSNLYGIHSKNETAVFSQLSATLLKKLKYNLGFRWESYRLNDMRENSRPVFRTGFNYQLFTHTFLRLSAGQGYRFPSIAEKFAATQVGALNIFPNPGLESEQGWSADMGIIQGYKLGSLNGFIDFSVFRNRYTNMIEYTFGVYMPEGVIIPTLDHVGFKALNIGKAQITGLEVILNAEKTTGNITTAIQAGYTYINPIDLNIEKDSLISNMLKYRHRHSFKADGEISLHKFSAGATIIHNSFMEQVDSVFIDPFLGNLILPGYPDYREDHQKGYTTVDIRAAYDILEQISISVICKNLFNVEYIGRPGDIQPHRSITFQLMLNL